MPVPGRNHTLTGQILSALGGPWGVLLGVTVIALLYLMHLRGPDLPHNLAELFCVVVAVGVFMLTWNARRFMDNHFFLFLGIAYLFVGVIDSLHALAFDGWIGGEGRLDTGEQLLVCRTLSPGRLPRDRSVAHRPVSRAGVTIRALSSS